MSVFQTVPACCNATGHITTATYLFNTESGGGFYFHHAAPVAPAPAPEILIPGMAVTHDPEIGTSTANVPEPATLALVLAGMLMLITCRRLWKRAIEASRSSPYFSHIVSGRLSQVLCPFGKAE